MHSQLTVNGLPCASPPGESDNRLSLSRRRTCCIRIRPRRRGSCGRVPEQHHLYVPPPPSSSYSTVYRARVERERVRRRAHPPSRVRVSETAEVPSSAVVLAANLASLCSASQLLPRRVERRVENNKRCHAQLRKPRLVPRQSPQLRMTRWTNSAERTG